MPWIYFERDEPAAPSQKLPSLDGDPLAPVDFRGLSGLVLFFAHNLECHACRSFIAELAKAVGTMRVQGAEALVILPHAGGAEAQGPGALHLLLDQAGALRQAYAAIFEFEVAKQAMLFILNQHNAPYRAWVGDEPNVELPSQMLKYLESAALLCPE